jgi:ferredoxin
LSTPGLGIKPAFGALSRRPRRAAVDCIYEGERMLCIQPGVGAGCGACEAVCPVEAIFCKGRRARAMGAVHHRERQTLRPDRVARRRFRRGAGLARVGLAGQLHRGPDLAGIGDRDEYPLLEGRRGGLRAGRQCCVVNRHLGV